MHSSTFLAALSASGAMAAPGVFPFGGKAAAPAPAAAPASNAGAPPQAQSNVPPAGVQRIALQPNTPAQSLVQPGAMEGLGMAGQTLPAAINPLGCSPPFNKNLAKPNAGQVSQAIQSYANNVKQVSAFLQTAGANPSDPGIVGNAITARNAENDETNHLNTLCSVGPTIGTVIFANSCGDLPANFFPEVVADLQNIADGLLNGPNPSMVTQMVNKINTNRCANVLPNIQNSWDGAAAVLNVASQELIAPTACSQINNNASEFTDVGTSSGVFSTQLTTQPPRKAVAFKRMKFL